MKELFYYWFENLQVMVGYFSQENKPMNSQKIIGENFLKPILENGIVVEGATPEEIAESEKEIVPEKVKKSNFKLALIKVGISTSVITEAIYAMPASLQKDKIIILWEDTDVFYRKDESLNEMAPSFNITQEQLDQLFILADTL